MESQIALCFLFAHGIFKMHGMVVGCSIWVWFLVVVCFGVFVGVFVWFFVLFVCLFYCC